MMVRQARPPATRRDVFVFRISLPPTRNDGDIGPHRRIDDPFDEHPSLGLIAECIYPDRFKDWSADVQFLALDELATDGERLRHGQEDPVAVGAIFVGKDKLDINGFLPTAAFWRLGAGVTAGDITSMTLHALRINQGLAYLHSITFHGPEFYPVEYVGC